MGTQYVKTAIENKPHQNVIIREASQLDNDQLILLTELTPMMGTIALRIDRRPDFFSLLEQRGEYCVLVAELKKQIVGSIGYARQNFILNGSKQEVFYICDFKVHPSFKKTRVTFLLLKAIHEKLMRVKARWLFSTIAFGNKDVLPGFEGRLGFPVFSCIGTFIIFQILPQKYSLPTSPNYIESSTAPVNIKPFYKSFYSRYTLCNSPENLDGCTHFYFMSGEEISASISVFDPGKLKQNVVIDVPVSIKIALSVLRMLQKFSVVGEVLRKNQPIRNLYVRHFGFTNRNQHLFNELIKQVRRYAFIHHYHFVNFSIHDNDIEMRKMVRHHASFRFLSKAYLANMDNGKPGLETLRDGIFYEDYSLV